MSIIHFPADNNSSPSLLTKRLLAESEIESPKSFESQLQERQKIQKQITERRQSQEEQKFAAGQKSATSISENKLDIDISNEAKAVGDENEVSPEKSLILSSSISTHSNSLSQLNASQKNISNASNFSSNSSILLDQLQLSMKPISIDKIKEPLNGVADSASSSDLPHESVSATAGKSENLSVPKESPVIQLRIPVPVHSSEWQQAINQHMAWIANHQMTAAEIHLNPPELGPVSARLKLLEDKKIQVIFFSEHQSVRSALAESLPQLGDLFSSQGLVLDKADILNQGDGELIQSFADFAGMNKNKIIESAYAINRSNNVLNYYA